MESKELTVTNPTGLHTRPGTEFVKRAKNFVSDITIKKGEKTANAKSIIKLLQIGISQGDTITLTACGDDESVAIAELAAYVQSLSE
ncbi:MAG: HPr family phosphocarrier protein [Treponema sp.]|nr:HPr family phosphocarrier protein [Treponema sp.]